MKTIAEQIVQEFFGDNPDGTEWPEGFAAALEDRSAYPPYRGAWDYGYHDMDCGCWASQPHHCGREES